MGDIALLTLGLAGALWCAALVAYALTSADRVQRDLLAGLMEAFSAGLAAAGQRRRAMDATRKT